MITKISNEVIAELAASSSYKERFIAEYILLKQKHEKLKVFNTKIEAAGEMAFRVGADKVPMPEHDCPEELLRRQQHVMGEYLHILEVRAVIEGIDLKEAVEALAIESIRRASENCTGEEEKCCCQSENTPPCEKEIYREAAGLMSLKQTISMWESLVDAEREAGESTFLATNTLYHLKKYAERLEPCHAIGENRDAKHK